MAIGLPAAMLISSVIAGGAGVAGSVLSNRKKTSETTPLLTPQMQTLLDQLLGQSQGMMQDPARGLAPIRRNAMDLINQRYAGSADRISTNLAKRGYLSSGKLPGSFVGLERSRLGDLSGLESTFSTLAADRMNQGTALAERILSSQTGRSATGTGDALGSGLSAAGSSLGSLTSLMVLSNLLKGGGTTPSPVTPQGYDFGYSAMSPSQQYGFSPRIP